MLQWSHRTNYAYNPLVMAKANKALPKALAYSSNVVLINQYQVYSLQDFSSCADNVENVEAKKILYRFFLN